MIESVWPNLPTCVVTFVEYGNTEEVLLSDIRPMISALVSSRSLDRGIGGGRGVGLLYGLTYRPVLSPLLNMVIQRRSFCRIYDQ